MNRKEWAKKEVELAKLIEYEDPKSVVCDTEEATLKARAVIEIENAYTDSVYEAALEVFEKLCDQNHSGMSIELTMHIVNRLVRGQALTPLQGTEDEWSQYEDWGYTYLISQNIRNSAVFRHMDKATKAITYTYNEVLVVVNEDDVWHNYPPLDEPGTLDDDFPATASYFKQRRALKNALNDKIVFPYVPETYKYKWNFETEELEEVKEA